MLRVLKYRKIPKISPGAYIFQRPFLRGLYSEGLIYGGKFAFQKKFFFSSSKRSIILGVHQRWESDMLKAAIKKSPLLMAL